MKKFLAVLFVLMFTAVYAQAPQATVTLAWDPMPAGQVWSEVRIYEKVDTVYTKVCTATVPANQCVFTATPGVHRWVARAYAAPWESADSNEVVTPAIPSAPGNARYTVVLMGN